MKPKRLFTILIVVMVFLLVSIILARRKLGSQTAIVIKTSEGPISDTQHPEVPGSTTQISTMRDVSRVIAAQTDTVSTGPCTTQKEYLDLRRDLGLTVNGHDVYEHDAPTFVRQLNEFRMSKGLPLPLQIVSNKLEDQNVVYNNCHATCKGMVNQVFVSRLIDDRFVEVLLKDGSHKKLPLHESGLEVATVDELNAKGVPFRSWLAPVSSGDWYLLGLDLYYALDIEGMWLKIGPRNNWEVVLKPKGLIRLTTVEPAEKILGCHSDELCLATPASGGKARYFRAPLACGPVLRHSLDEPSNRDENGNLLPDPAAARSPVKTP